MVFSDTTTSLSPASMETVDAGGLRAGYPAWIINEMIKLDIDPEAPNRAWRSAKFALLHQFHFHCPSRAEQPIC